MALVTKHFKAEPSSPLSALPFQLADRWLCPRLSAGYSLFASCNDESILSYDSAALRNTSARVRECERELRRCRAQSSEQPRQCRRVERCMYRKCVCVCVYIVDRSREVIGFGLQRRLWRSGLNLGKGSDDLDWNPQSIFPTWEVT